VAYFSQENNFPSTQKVTVSPMVTIKTYPSSISPNIQFGEEEISMKEFLGITCRFLTDEHLSKKDPRKGLIDCVRAMQVIEGYTKGTQRLSNEPLLISGPYIGGKKCVSVCDYLITPADFSYAVHYVLTNTSLEDDNDIRLQFVKFVREGKLVTESRKKRFVSEIPAELSE